MAIMGMNVGGGFRYFKLPSTKNLANGGGALPKPDNGPGPQPGNMQPIVRPNIPVDIDEAKKQVDNNINRDPVKDDLDYLINRNPLGDDLNNLANRNNWTWG